MPWQVPVRPDVGNEKAGGERAIYRDGSPLLCSGPSRGLWSAAVLVDCALTRVRDNDVIPGPTNFRLAALPTEWDCVGLAFFGRGLLPCRGHVPESGELTSPLPSPALALGRRQEGRWSWMWWAGVVRPASRIQDRVMEYRAVWVWWQWLWLWRWRFGMWRWLFGLWRWGWACWGGCRRSPSVDARRFCDQIEASLQTGW